MKLTIENVGPINKANIEINGITVIAGENGSGKTTICKLLYSYGKTYGMVSEKTSNNFIKDAICNSMKTIKFDIRNNLLQKDGLNKHRYTSSGALAAGGAGIALGAVTLGLAGFNQNAMNESFLKKEKIENIEAILQDVIAYIYSKYEELSSKELLTSIEGFKKKALESIGNDKNSMQDIFSELDKYINLIDKKQELSKILLERYLRLEFLEQLKSNDNDENLLIDFSYDDRFNDVILISNAEHLELKTGYSLSDRLMNINKNILNHKDDFLTRITSDQEVNLAEEFVGQERLSKIKSMLNDMIKGDFYFDKKEGLFIYDKEGIKYSPINIANGVKTLGYFSQLANMNFLTKNNILILDEPETSLHPEWQVKFANTLVEIHKEFGLKIVILSHSPYFIDAIRTFTKLNKVKNNWYLLKETKVGYHSIDTTDDVGLIANALDKGFDLIDLKKENFDDEE